MSDDGSKANVFFKSPHGDGHIQIAAADDADTIKRLITNTSVVLDWCASRGFEARPPTNGAKPEATAVACGVCGGPSYDNTAKKKAEPTWKGPTYKCKDKNCAATDWKGTGQWKQE